MYLIEAAPELLLGIAVIFYLKNGIDDALWLNRDEKAVLKSNLEEKSHQKADYPLTRLFLIGMMWVFTIIYLLIVIGVYGINFWLPSIIRATGVQSFLEVGLITAIPYIISTAIMIIATRHAERTNEKRWHTTAAAVLGGIGLILKPISKGRPPPLRDGDEVGKRLFGGEKTSLLEAADVDVQGSCQGG